MVTRDDNILFAELLGFGAVSCSVLDFLPVDWTVERAMGPSVPDLHREYFLEMDWNWRIAFGLHSLSRHGLRKLVSVDPGFLVYPKALHPVNWLRILDGLLRHQPFERLHVASYVFSVLSSSPVRFVESFQL